MNVASIAIGDLPGSQTVRRTVTNVSNRATYNVSVTGLSGINVTAVSYTHLDVYKRQGLATVLQHGWAKLTTNCSGSQGRGSITTLIQPSFQSLPPCGASLSSLVGNPFGFPVALNLSRCGGAVLLPKGD